MISTGLLIKFLPMPHNHKFGPAAQTCEQRAWVLAQMQDMLPHLKHEVTPAVQSLYDQYIAGKLSWVEMRAALDAG